MVAFFAPMLHGAVHRMAEPRGPMNDPGSKLAGSSISETSLRLSTSSANFSGLLGQEWDFWFIRLALFGSSVGLCLALRPFNFHGLPAAGFGFFIAMVVLLAELRLRHAEISGLVGGSIGVVLGLLVSLLITLVVSRTSEPESAKSFIEIASLLALGYLGLVIGTRRGRELRPLPLPEQANASEPATPASLMKLVDTSVLIDGRIADICETHFLDGSLGLPEAAPYDAIIVSAAAPRIPQALVGQLAVGGRLLIPVGESDQQLLQLVQRQPDGSTTVRTLEGCRFVPLIGEQGFVA